MSDIVERLRCHNRMASGSHYMDEAAAEIERLRDDKARLREALESLVDVGCEFYDMDCGKNGSGSITEARAALEATR